MINEENKKNNEPLAERMKPKKIDDFVGQHDILSEGKLLYRLIKADKINSIIFHGPPGTGKTSLARIIANTTKSDFQILNAVTSGVKDLREVFKIAENNLVMNNKKTILFIDEIHRFNKSQQDALLPYVENGTVTLIGATTENPYYEVNNALISRSMIFKLEALKKNEIAKIIKNTLQKDEYIKNSNIKINDDVINYLSDISNGDARRALNTLEIAILSNESYKDVVNIEIEDINNCVQNRNIKFDKNGDEHYDTISAFIKSMRGSDPDATLHYLARMIYAGEDPKFIARRILIQASEDVGNADPMALIVANSAFDAVAKIGMPEARIILSQAAVYVATAPKSNSTYMGIKKALYDVENGNLDTIPYHLKDGTASSIERKNNSKFKDEKTYKYPHGYENNYVSQEYLPSNLIGKVYYKSSNNGYEKKSSEYMKKIKDIVNN